MGWMRTMALVATLALVATACDWTMFRGGPQHTGESVLESAISIHNVASMTESWRSATFPSRELMAPVAVADGLAVSGGRVDASVFDLELCASRPVPCDPIQRLDPPGSSGVSDPPAVGGDRAYLVFNDANLRAFDLAGAGCPPACEPVWTAGPLIRTAPTIRDGRIYVVSLPTPLTQRLDVFDAAGVEGCSGDPVVCEPLWTAAGSIVGSNPKSATVAAGRVYLPTGNGRVRVFDAAGVDGCSGTPVTCSPLFVIDTGDPGSLSTVAATGGRGFVSSPTATYAFALEPCGVPTCSPLWSGPGGSGPAAVAGGVVYVGDTASLVPADAELLAFDAAGIDNCTGAPVVCAPLWSSALGADQVGAPTVANGVVFVATETALNICFDDFGIEFCDFELTVSAFAGGADGCGSPSCPPLWQESEIETVPEDTVVPRFSDPIVANGVLYTTAPGESVSSLRAFEPTAAASVRGA